MALKLMYITNRTDVIEAVQGIGVDRIFIDLEKLGKEARQPKMDTVKSSHTIDDVVAARKVLSSSELLVRINSIWDGTKKEIDEVVEAGADIIMLPFFKDAYEVERFLKYVDGRVKTCLLLETDSAVANIDDILSLGGIDEIHIGMNDLHLCYKKKFMFELLCDGTVEYLCNKFKNKNIPYGFGGVARIGFGDVPAELVLSEHYRLGSSMAILSRQFCKITNNTEIGIIKERFKNGIKEIRDYENFLIGKDDSFFEEMHREFEIAVADIVKTR